MEISDMLNIGNKDVNGIINDGIKYVREELEGLDKNLTCKIYSSYIYNYLKKKHVLCYIIDTLEDLGMDYQHRFVMVYDNDSKYIVDLNYDQFGMDSNFLELYNKGYQRIDDDIYTKYLDNIGKVVRKR